jgi:hypothetical protein
MVCVKSRGPTRARDVESKRRNRKVDKTHTIV